jgi:acyl-CoA thioester hydrolase
LKQSGGDVSDYNCTVKVRYAETDQMKVLHHSLWPVYWEVARGAFMESLGFPYGELEKDQGIYFPVISMGAEIEAPAYYDDTITLRCRVAELGRVKLRFHYEGWRGDTLLARGHSQHGVIDLDWKIVRLPEAVRDALAQKL